MQIVSSESIAGRIYRLMMTVSLSVLFFAPALSAEEKTMLVDIRQRPPEMNIVNGKYSGPLIEITEIAAAKAGYKAIFNERIFDGSMKLMELGKIDLIPRTVWTPDRAKRIGFIGPLGEQDKDILFLVKTGKEDSIKSFDDLKKFKVGVKKGTAYFEKFDKAQDIKKEESLDDDNMVMMFSNGRFDTMIVLDKEPLEKALKKNNITQYAYAKYKEITKLPLYYGVNPNFKGKEALTKVLMDMAAKGEIKKIFDKYGVKLNPPKK